MIITPMSIEARHAIALSRDESHFKEYFVRNFKAYEQYAFVIIKDRGYSQDIVSEIMWKIWHLDSDLMKISSVESYILRSIKNKCYNLSRVNKISYVGENEYSEIETRTPEVLYISNEQIQNIEKAIESLPLKTKEAFKYVKEDRKTYAEVADLMGISKKTVDRHIQNALSKLWIIIKEKK